MISRDATIRAGWYVQVRAKSHGVSHPDARMYVARVSDPVDAEHAVRAFLKLGDEYAVEADTLRLVAESVFETRGMRGHDVQEVKTA